MIRRWLCIGLLAAPAAALVPANALADPIAECSPIGGTPAPCTKGWYTTPMSLSWNLNDSSADPNVSLPGCAAKSFAGEINESIIPLSEAPVWDYCAYVIQNNGTESSGIARYQMKIELTDPVAAAVSARLPDANGWYNHPVTISFQGGAFSGIASCTPGVTYAGPDTGGTLIGGSCTDYAGKSASAAPVTIRYDATPPALSVTADPGDQGATIHWQATTDLAPLTSLQVVRSPGLQGATASVLAPRSGAGSYSDSHLRNRTAYTYTVTATDQAGNTATRSVVVRPGPRLLTPVSGARVSAPPMLSWTPVPRATYYNVQIFRGGKVLSAWPKRAHLRMSRTWSFAGHRHRLRRGRYRWYVWPGFGKRSAARYKSRVGFGTFVVR